ncbi:TadE/TadG family type IV pilus assembly protein [Blastococcus sp. SYSU DS0539]
MGKVQSERGAAAVEFALIVPLLIVLVLGIVEFGRAFQVQATLAAAAREGARVLALQGDEAAVEAAVQSASTSLNPGVTSDGITVSPVSCDGAPAGTNATVTVTYPMPFLTGFFGDAITLDADGVMRCNG